MSKQKVVAPEFEIVPMDNWNLKDLKTTFIIPDYERRVDRNHLKRMVEAILKNEFYDIVFRGVKREDGKIEVIDAQHRLQAFVIAHEDYDVKTYNFVLILYNAKQKRVIYRKLNQGKKLVAADHTLAMDDGKIPFFKELAPFAFHYRSRQRISFVDLLGAWNYCTTKRPQLRMDAIEATVSAMNKDSIQFLRKFMRAMTDNAGPISENPLYRAVFFKNIARISFENNLGETAIANLIRKIQRSKIPQDLLEKRSHVAMADCYQWVNKLLEGKRK